MSVLSDKRGVCLFLHPLEIQAFMPEGVIVVMIQVGRSVLCGRFFLALRTGLDMEKHKAKEGTSSDPWFKRLNFSKGALNWSQERSFCRAILHM
jgi:hypothetical protein